MKNLAIPVVVSAMLAATGCHKKPETQTTETTSTTTVPAATTAPAPVPAATPAAATAPAAPFDVSSVPVSTVKLGAFPYLSLPDGYVADNASTLDVARFPFWVGDRFEWVVGKVYQARIVTAPNKTFSKYEVEKNVDSLIEQAGGKKISEAKVAGEAIDKLTDDVKQGFNIGLGDIYSVPSTVYLIHQADRDIWINFTANTANGAWAIVEAKPFVATAKLLPATTP